MPPQKIVDIVAGEESRFMTPTLAAEVILFLILSLNSEVRQWKHSCYHETELFTSGSDDTFLYKKPFYKKPRAIEAKKLRN